MFRQISKIIMPNLERDLGRSVKAEVSSMEDLMLMAPRVFSYQPSERAAGAFGRTLSRQAPASGKFIRVEKSVRSKGLFSD
mmetsp:Transcript_6323/g.9308  ORF Transcript_6323/g.9308 Transcript_6323/m.9308 type:complete len:81 (+) Transcript_6323:44-286(+)